MSDFTHLPDLAAARLGGVVIAANDEFFAPKENLLKETKPIFVEDKFTDRGKWMDGWETRRRRTPGFDWCIIRLGLPGILRGVVADTSFFRGNYPEHFSLEACDLGGQPPHQNEAQRLKAAATRWTEILPQSPLKGDSQNSFAIAHDARCTHVRLKIYPDGGVARLRLHGEVVPGAKQISRAEIDLVAVENGGTVITSSDQFFGEPHNLLMPYRAKNMGDGWETKRRRGPGHDWVILKLGVPGVIRKIEVNTAHFKGNFPDTCSLEICQATSGGSEAFLAAPHVWRELLPQTKLQADHRHIFSDLRDVRPATHVRFHIYPDGGVSRLRLFGHALRSLDLEKGLRRFNKMASTIAHAALMDCSGSKRWATQMQARRPFRDVPALFAASEEIWPQLTDGEWLAAFAHHPAIGGKSAAKGQSTAAKRWSKGEQAVAQTAAPAALEALACANEEYRDKFGYVFLICATGKTSDEILAALRHRIHNDPAVELRTAAEEQRKITRIRLEKLLAS